MKQSVIVICLLAVTTCAAASDEVSIARGKELFSSPQLGTNGQSCILCHRDGDGLATASLSDDTNLGMLINRCIEYSLDGAPLDGNSGELKSLILYIRSLMPFARSK
jgi:mono/diheme cytochrome c family protein